MASLSPSRGVGQKTASTMSGLGRNKCRSHSLQFVPFQVETQSWLSDKKGASPSVHCKHSPSPSRSRKPERARRELTSQCRCSPPSPFCPLLAATVSEIVPVPTQLRRAHASYRGTFTQVTERLKASIDNLPAHPVDTQRICPFSPLPHQRPNTPYPAATGTAKCPGRVKHVLTKVHSPYDLYL